MLSLVCRAAYLAAFLLSASVAKALPPEAKQSVVSVLPVWPGHVQGGSGARPGTAPEGSGVAVAPGIIATAWHVIEPAERIDVRLHDGRILSAELIAADPKTDVALLSVSAALPVLNAPEDVHLADPVCAIGNAYGLGLSVTCGVVSALGVSNAGFNPVEDFIQSDASINPGMSGGALLDQEGRLVGMISAIFASQADGNVGVNFAVSTALLQRVTNALLEDGEVRLPKPGWGLARPERQTLSRIAAPVVSVLEPGGPAERAGLQLGDLLIQIEGRRVQTPRDAIAALAVLPQDIQAFDVELERGGQRQTLAVVLETSTPQNPETTADCPYPEAVCMMRQAVFPVSSYDPVGSATRIAPDLLVTNRHVIGDRMDAVVHTPNGPRTARVIPSSYAGDLVILQVDGLPQNGKVADVSFDYGSGPFLSVGADVSREEVRVFEPGTLLAGPDSAGLRPRLHVTARMQPGVSGGALVNEAGMLVGIAVGGGEGRFEAMPAQALGELLDGRNGPDASVVTAQLGAAFASCDAAIVAADIRTIETECISAANPGQLLDASRTLAQASAFDAAARMTQHALDLVPNSLNTRVTHLVVLQLGARFEEMVPHARRAIDLAPDDPRVLRFAIQAGLWGNDPELAEDGYELLLDADPVQAQAARRFLDSAPPAPSRP